jgi:hypothetical protein
LIGRAAKESEELSAFDWPPKAGSVKKRRGNMPVARSSGMLRQRLLQPRRPAAQADQSNAKSFAG